MPLIIQKKKKRKGAQGGPPSNNKRVFEGGTKFVFSDKNTICIIYSNSNYINFCNTYFKKTKGWSN